ncbi:hypothetical protein [uncultured Paraglaciecola sp.]|uniref:hypothetical protein n=1 Tax=uncultured Paraglaciecola sp. TaxID=1765024 RepID=UPI0030DA7CAF|tara:strand:+ start:133300 stop:133533 length:234 start_codon:yes stop_codon:yes gene_type:complete
MSFDKRHAKARWPFRILAFLFTALGIITGVLSIPLLTESQLTLNNILAALGVLLFIVAFGYVACTGTAPQWFLRTRK